MKRTAAALAAVIFVLSVATPARAHRLDEYLQATTLGVSKDRVSARVRLTPGVAVLRTVLAGIDTDGDGNVSESEQRAYAERVRRDLSLAVDDDRLPLRLVSSAFPTMEQMKEGLGDIDLEFDAAVPPGGAKRRLVFQNRHRLGIAAYLVNCLAPSDADVQIKSQQRDYEQSFYQLDYTQSGGRAGGLQATTPTIAAVSPRWLLAAGLVPLASLALLWRRRGPKGTSAAEPGGDVTPS
jgi:hypothetical protein